MKNKLVCSFTVLYLISILFCASVARFSAQETTGEPSSVASDTFDTAAVSETGSQPITEQPTTYVKPLKYPSLSVSAISNYFGRINSDYNQYTKEITVTYYFKANYSVLTTQWDLEFDSNVLKLDKKKNTPETVCPIIGKNAAVGFEKDHVTFTATDLNLFSFKADDSVFARLVFDVAVVPENEPQITKIDLTLDTLILNDGKNVYSLCRNFNVTDPGRLSGVSVSKYIALTESNYVEPTTAPPVSTAVQTPDEASSADSSVTEPSKQETKPSGQAPPSGNGKQGKKKEAQPEQPALVDTGNPWLAALLLVLSLGGMTALLAMRKRVMLREEL